MDCLGCVAEQREGCLLAAINDTTYLMTTSFASSLQNQTLLSNSTDSRIIVLVAEQPPHHTLSKIRVCTDFGISFHRL